MAEDTAIPDLTAIAGADVADADSFGLADLTAGTTKELPVSDLIIALKLRNVTTMEFGEPADGTILAGNGVFWVDTTASPQTFNCKTKNTNSPEEIVNFVLG